MDITPTAKRKFDHSSNFNTDDDLLSSLEDTTSSKRNRKKRDFFVPDSSEKQLGGSRVNLNFHTSELVSAYNTPSTCTCLDIIERHDVAFHDNNNRELMSIMNPGGVSGRYQKTVPSFNFKCPSCCLEDEDEEVMLAQEAINNTNGSTRLLDINNLSHTIENCLCCGECTKNQLDESKNVFLSHLEDTLDELNLCNEKEKILNAMEKKIETCNNYNTVNKISVNEVNHGIATSLQLQCYPESKKKPSSHLKTPHLMKKANIVQGRRYKPSNQRVVHNFMVHCSESSEFGGVVRKCANCRYSLNILFVLATLANGNGPLNMSTMIAFLGLPGGKTYHKNINIGLCTPIYKKIIEHGQESMKQAIEEEIKLTIEKEHPEINYEEWRNKPLKDREAIGLNVSYDMGWNKRSSGRRYDSLSGHAFMVGCYSKKILLAGVKSKSCAKCDKKKTVTVVVMSV